MKQSIRHYNLADKICLGIDQALRALAGQVHTSQVPYPAKKISDADMTPAEQKHAAALMRINHTGEICAQALYHGQGAASRNDQVQFNMQQAALEEGDHLDWCKLRLDELNSHTSYLNPLWYAGSFCIGLTAGMIGDAWSLGFVAETEAQVIKHLEKHRQLLPKQDARSHAILKKMELDEAKHRNDAIAAGARELPMPVKKIMSLVSKIMVKTVYWV
jgi:3-demethoxyubiquinol 3-hydroxylase